MIPKACPSVRNLSLLVQTKRAVGVGLIDSAIAELFRLRDRLSDADPVTVRDAIKRTIGNVSIWWEPATKCGYRVKKASSSCAGFWTRMPHNRKTTRSAPKMGDRPTIQ